MADSVFVSDFDGTVTQVDFYTLIAERYLPEDVPDYFEEYRQGRISHFDAMQGFFQHAPSDPQVLEQMLRDTRPEPDTGEMWRAMREAGWDLSIVSAGSSWYIERILGRFGIEAAVHSNPGEIRNGSGLQMRLPRESPFFCPDVGIDKPAVVRDALSRYERVAFAGDGPPDAAPALLVKPELRFARGYLAEELQRRGEPFKPFTRWTDVVRELLA